MFALHKIISIQDFCDAGMIEKIKQFELTHHINFNSFSQNSRIYEDANKSVNLLKKPAGNYRQVNNPEKYEYNWDLRFVSYAQGDNLPVDRSEVLPRLFHFPGGKVPTFLCC